MVDLTQMYWLYPQLLGALAPTGVFPLYLHKISPIRYEKSQVWLTIPILSLYSHFFAPN